MKLVQPDFFCQIELQENFMETVVVENTQDLVQYAMELRGQIEGTIAGRWVLSEHAALLDMQKKCQFIIDPFSMDLNNRKMLAALYSMVEKEVQETELLLCWQQIYPTLMKAVEAFAAPFDYSLTYAEDIGLKDFLKFMELRYAGEAEDFFERLLDYLRLAHEILKIDVFIFLNLKTVLTVEQLKFLYEQSCYAKYQMLLFEAVDIEDKHLSGERITIIDKSGCVIK